MQIEHGDINRIERLGFPDPEFLEWELRLEKEEFPEEEWPDGMTWQNWQKEKPTASTAGNNTSIW